MPIEPNVVDLDPLAIHYMLGIYDRAYILVITFRSPLRRRGRNVRITSWGAFTFVLNVSVRLSMYSAPPLVTGWIPALLMRTSRPRPWSWRSICCAAVRMLIVSVTSSWM